MSDVQAPNLDCKEELDNILHIGELLTLARLNAENARVVGKEFPHDEMLYITISKDRSIFDGLAFHPCKMGQIVWFHDLTAKAASENKHVVICAGKDCEMVTTCSFLIGSILILYNGYTLEQVEDTFRPFSAYFIAFQDSAHPASDDLAIHDCWKALSHAKCLGWLDVTNDEPDVDKSIDIAEHLHYDDPANGNLHVLVPSKLLVFECPHDLPADPSSGAPPRWADVDRERRFGAAHYADILCDFDVCCVVQCGGGAYDAAPLHARGIAVEAVEADAARRETLMRAVDRFLTLARLAPGPLAVHGGEAGAGGALGAAGEVLVSALLIRRFGFSAKAAVAWLRVLHPGRPLPALSAAVSARPRAAAATASAPDGAEDGWPAEAAGSVRGGKAGDEGSVEEFARRLSSAGSAGAAEAVAPDVFHLQLQQAR